ncbi:MAG TPA: proton-conducting transporter membrane subunit [Alphaproteobacteria bacterium]|nr:proton-conducting transporter membrane subunit [Alphaproteobacteria bacterium]
MILAILPLGIVTPLMGAILSVALLRWRYSYAVPTITIGIHAILSIYFMLTFQDPFSVAVGNWTLPYGIELDISKEKSWLLVLTSVLSFFVHITSYQTKYDHRKSLIEISRLILLAGLSGIILTADLFNLYVWFEITLITATGLLLAQKKFSLKPVINYMLINLLGTSFFLIGVGIIYGLTGSLNMAEIADRLKRAPDFYLNLSTALLMLGLLIKSAAFPFNLWLVAAYPRVNISVSAMLAGLVSKLVLFVSLVLIGRIIPISAAYQYVLLIAAILTMAQGAFGSLRSTQILTIAVYQVIFGIGFVIFCLGLPDRSGQEIALTYIIQDMVTKTLLFLLIGYIAIHSTNYLIVSKTPFHFFVIILVVFVLLNSAGFPLLPAFWPKISVLLALIERQEFVLIFSFVLLNFINIIALGRLWFRIKTPLIYKNLSLETNNSINITPTCITLFGLASVFVAITYLYLMKWF